MSEELINVLMPAWNRENTIQWAIDSILKQTHKNLKLYIYDDGSTDKTKDIVSSYNDDRIIYKYSATNNGVQYARNQLMQMAGHGIGAWMDADDLSNIHRLKIQLGDYNKQNKCLVCCTYQVINGMKNPNTNNIPRLDSTKRDSWGAFASSIFRIEDAVQFPEEYSGGGGDTMWWRLMLKKFSETSRSVLHQKLYYVRKHSERITFWKSNLSEAPDEFRKHKRLGQ